MTVAALLVAAGRGTRVGGARPKQYLDVAGKPVLRRTVEAFLACDAIAHLLVVIHHDDGAMYREAVLGLTDARLLEPVPGGASRAASVSAGLERLSERNPDKVLIHDAARPFCPQNVILSVIDVLENADGACAALPVVDALWHAVDGYAQTPVPRDGLWRAQTPQGFRFPKILAAHRECTDPDAADDVAVARAAGLSVKLVRGSEDNFKITTPEDLIRAEEYCTKSGR